MGLGVVPMSPARGEAVRMVEGEEDVSPETGWAEEDKTTGPSGATPWI